MFDISFKSTEQGLTKLKEYVNMRDQMGGSLYWNIVQDTCIKLADNLYAAGVSRSEISDILHSRN